MRKQRLQELVAEQLALRGYRASHYTWPKRARLQILSDVNAKPDGNARLADPRNGFKGDDPLAGCYSELHLTTRMTKRAIFAALDTIPRRGDAVAVAKPRPTKRREAQLEAEVD